MSLNLDKSSWKRVRLGDVIRRSRTQLDPVSSGVERYVAGGHVDTEGVTIERWGQVGDGQMGSTFRYAFKPGQVLFVSARPYLRKVGVPDFSGVVADKTYVLDAIPENGLLQEFLPFLLSSEPFVDFAISQATGSMNPRLLWGPMQRYELELPPPDEQERLADLLSAIERHRLSVAFQQEAVQVARKRWLSTAIDGLLAERVAPFEATWAASPESGWSASPVDNVTGRYVLSLAALGPDGYRRGQLKNVPDSPESRSATLTAGDLLVSRANTVEAVGRAGIFDERREDVSFPDTMMRLRLINDVRPKFAEAVLSSSHGRAHMRRTAAGSATSMVKINRKSLARLSFPIVSIDRQERLLAKLSGFGRGVASLDSLLAEVRALNSSLSAEIFGG
ncbi:restriction endonuclease subunit S [Micromonospora sp. WMMD967]|uniref:restriction endonuclease subunit S n=1 Tax=Micromonospora sp. WMMD967 TaxID=3016101 RepID=UPI002416EE0C|nr:restriction endonuclease subunit S [Micromonospora sp. WMMD967]MDG4837158.1 restriction endonuclease subunit S [Micromonospora sp. WMMD967]